MTVGILAILAGLVGAYAVRSVLLSEGEPAAPPPAATMEVPLASTDLPAGRVITMGDVGLAMLTSQQRRERGLDSPLVMMAAEQVIGRRLRVPLKQGEPFLTTSVYLEGMGPNVSELLKPGFRAYTLQLSSADAANFAAGSTIDVIFRSAPQGGIPATTVTLLQGVEVLSVDRPPVLPPVQTRLDGGGIDLRPRGTGQTRPTTMTLAVTLEQANILQTVAGRGELTFVPRAPGETLVSYRPQSDRFTLEGLLGLQPPPPPFVTEIYRRGSRQSMSFGPPAMGSGLQAAPNVPMPTP